MRKFVLLLAAVVAMSLTGLAQTSSQGTSSGTDTQTTTTTTQTTKHAKHAKGEAGESAATEKSEKSAKESQLTGCLAKDPSGSGYMLTNGKYKKGVEVKSSEDLSAHVGHEVKLMGTWEKPTAGEAGGAGAKGETMRTFNATKLDHISDTCKAAGAAKSKGKKSDKTAAAPSSY
jgi:hypothetical protein